MAQITKDCSSNVDILAVFSNLDADLRSLAPCSPTISTDPDVIVISSATSPLTFFPNQISNDEPVSPDSNSTIEASDKDPAVEASSTAGVQFIADDTNKYQHELPPAYSLPTDCRIVVHFFRAPISLSTAPRLLIQSTATNITKILLLPNRQQLSDHGSIPYFAMA